MSNKTFINNKISEIEKYLFMSNAYIDYSRVEIEKNDMIRLSLERVLFLVLQASIDLGEIVIAYKHLRKAASLHEIFEILQEHKIISHDLMKKLAAMTGFRNIIVHDYAKIDYDRVYEILHKDLKDIEEFASVVEKL